MQEVRINFIYINHLPVFFLDKSGIDYDTNQRQEEDSDDPGKGKSLVCHVCRAEITTRHDRVSVMGSHLHSKINPAGFAYHFECYSSAPGCLLIGEPSKEHTWFNGYAWQVASCRQCLEHLGWLFRGDTQFFGLIQGRLIDLGLE